MSPRVTIVDVAREAGVAISSASTALNDRPGVSDATRERIKAVAEQLGYVPSLRGRSLSSKKGFAIGLVVRRAVDVLEDDPFFGAFIAGIEEAISPRGYALVLTMAADEDQEQARYRELVSGRRVDGVILSELRENDSRIALVRELDVPAVGTSPLPFADDIAAVLQPSAPGIAASVRHLIDLGHTDIAHVSGTPETVHARERVEAWRRTLEEAGLAPGRVVAGDFSYASGRRAADELLADRATAPTAVVCANDLSAIGLVIRAQELGYDVPGDLSVTGFDGIAMSRYLRPTLTTVQTTPRETGAAAASLLLDRIEHPENEPSSVQLPPGEFVVRQSTGAPRHTQQHE